MISYSSVALFSTSLLLGIQEVRGNDSTCLQRSVHHLYHCQSIQCLSNIKLPSSSITFACLVMHVSSIFLHQQYRECSFLIHFIEIFASWHDENSILNIIRETLQCLEKQRHREREKQLQLLLGSTGAKTKLTWKTVGQDLTLKLHRDCKRAGKVLPAPLVTQAEQD